MAQPILQDYEFFVIRIPYGNKSIGDIIDIQPAGFGWGPITKRNLVIGPISGINDDWLGKLRSAQYEDGLDSFPIPDDSAPQTKRVRVSKRLYRIPMEVPEFQNFFSDYDWPAILSGELLDPFRDGTYVLDVDVSKQARILSKYDNTLKKLN